MSDRPVDPERTRRRWKRAINGSYLLGALAIVVGVLVDYQLVGAVAYLLGIVLGTSLWAVVRYRRPIMLYDERDRRIERRASYRTIMTAGAVVLAVFPVLFVLEAAGYYELEPPLVGVLYAFSALFLFWGAFYSVERVQS